MDLKAYIYNNEELNGWTLAYQVIGGEWVYETYSTYQAARERMNQVVGD